MSASHLPALRATALQAAVTLARYERHVRRLSASWPDIDLYSAASKQIDEVRALCAPLPGVAVPVARLLISHAELIHALWQQGEGRGAAEEVATRLREHQACIDALARHCLRASDAA